MINDIFDILWQAIGIALLSLPLIWELYNDRNGDEHMVEIGLGYTTRSKELDIVIRSLIALAASAVVGFLGINGFTASLFMSFSIHFLFFDYIVVIILKKNAVITPSAKWYNYLGSKGIDTKEWWAGKHWTIRMAIKIAVFVIACLIYF